MEEGQKTSKFTGCYLCIVGCRVVVQLGGPDPPYNWAGPTKVGAYESYLINLLTSCKMQPINDLILHIHELFR